MSKLAKLDKAPTAHPPSKRGPKPSCDVYGPGTLEDWEAVEQRRLATSWAEAQLAVDQLLGITERIPNDNFRYHWRRKCSCWARELRQ